VRAVRTAKCRVFLPRNKRPSAIISLAVDPQLAGWE
jgi:hypothetical protein